MRSDSGSTRQSWIGSFSFDLPRKYFVVEPIGQGSYGVVCAAVDTSDMSLHAVKRIGEVCSRPLTLRRTIRELLILKAMQHENVIGIDGVHVPGKRGNFNHLYVITELLDTDLQSVLRSDQRISMDQLRFIMYQIFRGLKYIHSAGVLHRDLKPRNILLNQRCDVKICDFGLAKLIFAEDEPRPSGFDNTRGCDNSHSVSPHVNEISSTLVVAGDPSSPNFPPMSEYICTRWYRPPEVLFNNIPVGFEHLFGIDTWAVGCIMGEIMIKDPLFAGNDYDDQVKRVLRGVGAPDLDVVETYYHPNNLDKLQKGIKLTFGSSLMTKSTSGDLVKRISSTKGAVYDSESLSLLRRLLDFGYPTRMTVAAALEHKFVACYHCDSDEPVYEPGPNKFLSRDKFAFETSASLSDTLRSVLFSTSLRIQPENEDQHDRQGSVEDENLSRKLYAAPKSSSTLKAQL